MQKIRIIGAGFSGLSLAWACSRLGFDVEIWEKGRIGGLIKTAIIPEGSAEEAANGLLLTAELKELADDLNLSPLATGRQARARWIFHAGKFRKWPLNWKGNFELARGLFHFFFGARQIKRGELVSEFLDRTFGSMFRMRLAEPALQGIYGGSVSELSANLVLGPTWRRENKGPRPKGTVSFPVGMGTLTSKMEEVLVSRGVRFIREEFSQVPYENEAIYFFCGSLRSTEKLLQKNQHRISEELSALNMRGISSVTIFIPEEKGLIPGGFGVLFPKSARSPALGVLFNHCLFDDRAKPGLRSETWILDSAIIESEQEVLRSIEDFRKKEWGSRANVVGHHVVSWPEGLPVYDQKLEDFLRDRNLFEPLMVNGTRVFLHGNYLGGIGLSKILSRSNLLAHKVKRMTHE